MVQIYGGGRVQDYRGINFRFFKEIFSQVFFYTKDSSGTIDLAKIAELLENSIRSNDKYTVRRILDENYSFFRIKPNIASSGLNSNNNNSKPIANDFLTQNCSITNLNANKTTPSEIPSVFFNILHLAIENNSHDVLRICLKYGINPNEPGTSYKNVKFNSENRYSCNKKSISYPVKCDYCKKRNKTQNQKASSSNKKHFSIKYQESVDKQKVECAQKEEELPSLSPYPISSDEVDYTSYTYLVRLPPIFLSISKCNHSATELLLTYDACSNLQDEFGNTPLHLAIAKQAAPCQECMYILLKNHATSLVFNNRFQSPMDLIEMLNKKDPDRIEEQMTLKYLIKLNFY